MATQKGLYDSTALAVELLQNVGMTDGTSKESKAAIASLQNILETRLKEYSTKHDDLVALYDRLKNDSESKQASFTRQISDLMKEIQRQKDKNEEDVQNTARIYKQQRDEVTKAADNDRAAMELERAKLEDKKKEAKDEIDRYKRQTQEAVEERAKTIQLWEEECSRSAELAETINSLQKAQKELEYEATGWRGEVAKVVNLKERMESERDRARNALQPTLAKNEKLTQELDKLKPKLKSAKETIAKQEKDIKKLREELQRTTEQLDTYKARSRESTPDNAPKGKAAFKELGKENTDDSDTDTPEPGGSLSRSEELQIEKDKNEELKAKIETDYVPREDHEKIVKEAADLKAERDRLQNAATNCQEALKKLQDEMSKKDGAKIKELKARIRDLEKQIKAFEDGANTHKADFARQRDRIQDLEKQLKAAKGRIATLEKLEREQQTKIANQQTKISELKNKASTQSDSGQPEGSGAKNAEKTAAEVARLEEELKRVQGELQNTTQELTELRSRQDSHLDQLAEAENAHFQLQARYDAMEIILEQRNAAQDWLQEDLLEAVRARDRLQASVERLLEPNINVADLQVFSEQVLRLVRLRQRAFNMVERVIQLSVRAADDYRAVTGTGFVIHGHGTTEEGRLYITEPDAFERDFRNLYTTLLDRIRNDQGEITNLRNQVTDGANNAIAQETVDAMQKQINALEAQNRDLEQALQTSQRGAAIYTDDAPNLSDLFRETRRAFRRFLEIPGPDNKDLDNILDTVVRRQRLTAGVIPFGQTEVEKARRLDETVRELETCRTEGTRLQQRNKAISSNLDNIQTEHRAERNRLQAEAMRLQAEVARLTAELKALRDTRNQGEADTRRQLEEEIGRLTAQIQTLTDVSNADRARHAEQVAGLTTQLEAVQARLEQTRELFAADVKRRDDGSKAFRDETEAEATRLNLEITRLTGELQVAKDSCARERRQIEGERKRLADELDALQISSEQERLRHQGEVRRLNRDMQRTEQLVLAERRRVGEQLAAVNGELQALRTSSLKERQRLEAEVARLNTELQTLRDTTDQERRRLEAEVARLTAEQQRLEAELARVTAELTALQNTIEVQNNVIGNNGQQANRTRQVLEGQIDVFGVAQRDLMRSIEAMREQATAQGRSAAEVARTLTRARREIAMFQTLVQELTVQRDLLQDEVALCEETQRRGRQRLRENRGPAPAPAVAGNAVAARRRGLVAGTGDFIGRTYSLFLRTVQRGTVWGTLGTVFVMMCAVIIAEGRQYAEWQDANAHSRALWMATRDRPTVCLGPPNMDYFWHTLVVVLTGRWTFR